MALYRIRGHHLQSIISYHTDFHNPEIEDVDKGFREIMRESKVKYTEKPLYTEKTIEDILALERKIAKDKKAVFLAVEGHDDFCKKCNNEDVVDAAKCDEKYNHEMDSDFLLRNYASVGSYLVVRKYRNDIFERAGLDPMRWGVFPITKKTAMKRLGVKRLPRK